MGKGRFHSDLYTGTAQAGCHLDAQPDAGTYAKQYAGTLPALSFFTNTPFSLVPPTKTPKPPTPTRTPKAPFSVIVNYVPSSIFYPELGCSYFGVAGEAVDSNNAPYKFGIIKIGGTLNGQTIDPDAHTTVTGVATQFGVGGFELVLNMPPTDSKGTLWIQMFDVAGIPQSEQKPINTYADCQKNLVQVRFKGNRP
ncbi:MAG: hypothetical protein QM730_11890 [Anaerolineales bacterium]